MSIYARSCLRHIRRALQLERRPKLVHGALVFVLFGYAAFGTVIFYHIEAPEQQRRLERNRQRNIDCIQQFAATQSKVGMQCTPTLVCPFPPSYFPLYLVEWIGGSDVVSLVDQCLWNSPFDEQKWTYTNAFFYAFGILTTIGFSSVSARSDAGKVFCIFYGLIGIPATMLMMANVGNFVAEVFVLLRNYLARKRQQRTRWRIRFSHPTTETVTKVAEKENQKRDLSAPRQLDSPLVIFVSVLYIATGTALWYWTDVTGTGSALSSLYTNFLCIMALDFGPLVDNKPGFVLPLVVAYICVGVAITTMALEVGSVYLKQLHYLGARLVNCRLVQIWFGGNRLSVGNLVTAVGRAWKVPQNEIEGIDIDAVVGTALKEEEEPEEPADVGIECKVELMDFDSIDLEEQPPSSPEPEPSPPPPPPTSPPPMEEEVVEIEESPVSAEAPADFEIIVEEAEVSEPTTSTSPTHSSTSSSVKKITFDDRRKAILEMKDVVQKDSGGSVVRSDAKQLKKLYEEEWRMMEERKMERRQRKADRSKAKLKTGDKKN